MKAAIFVPHGAFRREAGLVYVLANYLSKMGADVQRLACNGAVLACGRDEASGWRRTMGTCLRCQHEQQTLSSWAGLKVREISSFLQPEDASKSSEWIEALQSEEILRAEFRGTNVFSLCDGTFAARFGRQIPDFSNEAEARYAKDLMIGAIRACVATERFVETFEPDIGIVTARGDNLERAFSSQLAARSSPLAVVRFDMEDDETIITTSERSDQYVTKLVFEGLQRMRSDPRTWAPEITSVVHEILSFLGYGADRAPS